jgi:hypothetical protein
LNTEPAHGTLVEALLAFHAEAPDLHKDKANPAFRGSKYLSLDGLTDAVRPLLTRHGLVWTAMPSSLDGNPALSYRLLHKTGELIEGTMPLMLSKQDAQGQGSALTYARRYALMAVLNLVADEDDDGHGASGEGQGVAASPPSPPGPSQHKDDVRPPNPKIPRDRAIAILKKAKDVGMATFDMEAEPGTAPEYHPAFNAVLALQAVAKIGDLNSDTAEAVEAWLANEATS